MPLKLRPRGRASGFTLVELMIVVVILGILAAIAIPAFTRYVKKSKTAEATTNVAHIVRGEVTVYQQYTDSEYTHFVTASLTPSAPPTASKYPANPTLWTSDPAWSALSFSIDTGHYYQYETGPVGGAVMVTLLLRLGEDTFGPSDAFAVTARGDIDGDGEQSAFTRTGTLNAGEIQLSQLEITSELE